MKTIALLLMLAAFRAPLLAQDAVQNIKNSTLDTSVPESPAFTVLGLTPTTITRPASPRALASSLLSGVDQNGNFQTGIAVDTAPYMLFYGNQVTLSEYRDDKLVRLLARTGFSFATTKGTSETDKSSKLAAGLSVTIFDKGDPRTDKDFDEKLAKNAKDVLDNSPPLTPLSPPNDLKVAAKKREDAVEAAAKPIREAFQKASWNRSSWIIAGAPSWISKDGTSSHLAPNGTAVWTSVAYGFETVPGLRDTAQLIAHARFHSKENVPDPANAGKFYQQQSAVVGAKVRLGTESTVGSFETVYVHDRPINRPTDEYFRLTFGGEKRLSDNVWLHFGIGGESGAKNGQNKLFLLGAFKWGTGPK